jgi:hypothetical protein
LIGCAKARARSHGATEAEIDNARQCLKGQAPAQPTEAAAQITRNRPAPPGLLGVTLGCGQPPSLSGRRGPGGKAMFPDGPRNPDR